MPVTITLPRQANSSVDRAAELAVEPARKRGQRLAFELDDLARVAELLERRQAAGVRHAAGMLIGGSSVTGAWAI